MIDGINIDEYVSESMGFFREVGEKPTKHELATSIAEILCDQGHIDATVDAFTLAVEQLEAELDYYVLPGELARA